MFKPVYNNINENINWVNLSKNPNAIDLLQQNLNKVDWSMLSCNPNAIPLLEKNLDKVDWRDLSKNSNAIPILEKNLDKVNWSWLSSNPNMVHLFAKLDTVSMREKCKYLLAEELIQYVFHPGRLIRMSEQNKIEFSDYLDLL